MLDTPNHPRKRCSLSDKPWNGFDPRISWQIACTLPRREAGARDRLVELGFSVFLPMWTTATGRLEPLWPGYVLLNANGSGKRAQDVGPISRLMLAPGGGVAEIPGSELLWLWEAERGGLLRERARSLANDPNGVAQLKTGSRLQALAGPFIGCPCLLESSDGLERAKVLFDLFGRQTQVDMALADLRAVG